MTTSGLGLPDAPPPGRITSTNTDLAELLEQVPAKMRETLAADDPGFAFDVLKEYFEGSDRGRAEIEQFFEDDGLRLVDEGQKALLERIKRN